MSAYPGPAAVAAASEILEAAGYHPHKSTIVNALRAADSAATFDRRNEPARPVEEREPVGPYAPTRTGVPLSLAESAVLSALSDLIVTQLNTGLASLGNRFDSLVDVVLGLGRQMTDNRVWASERFDRIDTALTKLTDLFVDSRDEIERIALADKASTGYALGKNHGMRDIDIRVDAAFERGRQQGDADRAQRGELATDAEMNAPISDQAQKNVREALMSAEEHRHRGYEAGFSGGKIVGAVEREAELLDQGWTPPDATSVDARLLEIVNSDYPTEYEVWRDAVSIAGAQRDRRPPAKDLADRLTADAEWFWELLQQVPVLKFEDRTKPDDALADRYEDDRSGPAE